jgi:hypothetical protein
MNEVEGKKRKRMEEGGNFVRVLKGSLGMLVS